MAGRPQRLVVLTGTGTEVGKTWVGCALAPKVGAVARKPAQSFDPADEGQTDADLLAEATADHPLSVCPAHRWYPVPMAPPMAASVLGKPQFVIDDLAREVSASWPGQVPVGLVEGAGGVRSPLALDGDSADLARALGAEIAVVVADAGLGTINAVRLSVAALGGLRAVVFLNRYDTTNQLHGLNRDWLRGRDGYEVVTTIDDLAAAVTR